MATEPTTEELRERLIDIFLTMGRGYPRTGFSLPHGTIFESWRKSGGHQQDLPKAVKSLCDEGVLDASNPSGLRLTQKAFELGVFRLPTPEDIENMIWAFLRSKDLRPNESFISSQLTMHLFNHGIPQEEMAQGLLTFSAKDYLISKSENTLMLTQKGFDAL